MSFAAIPGGARACGVEAAADASLGRPALRLALEPSRRKGTLGRDFGDEPTFLLLPGHFSTGTIGLDLRSRLLPDAPDYARGFIGLAYAITTGAGGAVTGFQAVYLRPLNGIGLAPPPPRGDRAVQWFAWPDHKYDRLRETHPGAFEAGADIGQDRWHRLEIDLSPKRLRAKVDGALVLDLTDLPQAPAPGQIGLWVDIGTMGWFAGLTVSPE